MSVIKLSSIYEFFQTENSKTLIKKGEKSEESKRVLNHMYDGTVGLIKGKVQASQKQQQYSLEIQLEGEKIAKASCTCPNGQFECHHMAALLIHCHKNLSKTDSMNRWIQPGPSKKPVESIPELHPPKQFKALGCEFTDEDRSAIRDEINQLNRFRGMFWILQEERETPSEHAFPTIQDIIATCNNVEEVIENIKVAAEDIIRIAEATVQQRDSSVWHGLRLGRLTASKFGDVIHAINRNRFPKSLFSSILGKANLDGVKSIQWGMSHEEEAKINFQESMNLEVTSTGLWLHPSGMLGASPDGLIGSEGILEVKCPFTLRNATKDELLSGQYCFNHSGELNTDHVYYHQVQGQLHILNRSFCYFLVWTTKTIHMNYIKRDPEWSNNIEKLISFYKSHLLPKLMD